MDSYKDKYYDLDAIISLMKKAQFIYNDTGSKSFAIINFNDFDNIIKSLSTDKSDIERAKTLNDDMMKDLLFIDICMGTMHDAKNCIQNINAYISSLISLLPTKTTHTKPGSSLIRDLTMQTDQLRSLYFTLSRFLKKSKIYYEDVLIAKIINRAHQHFKYRLFKNNIQFYNRVENNKRIIQCVPDELYVALINLFDNSIDAIISSKRKFKKNIRGKIDIKLNNKPNKRIEIEIKDNGIGIPQDQFNNIFNSTYSTKPKGYGVGLSLCKRIIQDTHNGSITVDSSQKSEGTKFIIELPLEQ